MEKQEGREAAEVRTDDPWYDALASGWGELDGTGTPTTPVAPAPAAATEHESRAAEIYLEVQRSAAFQEVRSRYRRFVVPATLAFLVWYLAYVVAATTAPELMARPVAGAVNVAMVAGLGQFLSTFLLTWAYSRHARLHRDRDALDLRWSVFDRTRTQEHHRTRESVHHRPREQHGTQEQHTAWAGERR
ncbi:DUF485 domain-containing protein [Streptomyces sp. NPDC051217]|uniref:DUF485 domain-containing protein n=1 Tax=Streptomyces sp. NPDC051217 TaxID=3365644 RepID=UPI0037BDEA72